MQERDAALHQFANVDDIQAMQDGLTSLMKYKALPSLKGDSRIDAGIKKLLKFGRVQNLEGLLAISMIAKIASVPAYREDMGKYLDSIISTEPQDAILLNGPDDRVYIARAIGFLDRDWIASYSARQIVMEAHGKAARSEFAGLLCDRSASLSQVFELLLHNFLPLKIDTKTPGDSTAKRLNSVLLALGDHVVSKPLEVSDDTGQRLQEMLAAAFKGVGSPESEKVKTDTLDTISNFVHELARTQLLLITDGELYGALEVPRKWYQTVEWSHLAKTHEGLRLVLKDLAQAIVLLARQRITDDSLLRKLVMLCGSRSAAREFSVKLVEKHPEIDAKTKTWLLGSKTESTAANSDLKLGEELETDVWIGNLMIEAHRARLQFGQIEPIVDELRILEPKHVESLESLRNLAVAVSSSVLRLGNKRKLELRGEIGSRVEYSPELHEIVGGTDHGIRYVVIAVPMVVRTNRAGGVSILRKAVVETL